VCPCIPNTPPEDFTVADLDTALAFAQAHRDRFLKEYKDFLAIPSISTLPQHQPDVARAAGWLADQLKDAGMTTVEILPTPGHAIVYAEWLGAPGKPTVLVYGHYDVQPVDPLDEWETGPFEGAQVGDYIIARGASDMKGQIFAQVKALEALVKSGGCPVNIKYLVEGEEEIGSPNLDAFIAANLEKLKADFVLNCDAGIHEKDVPAITYSLRGLAYWELEIRTAKKDLHSGLFGGSIHNPIHVLSSLLAGLHDAEGRVTLPGFYDKVQPLTEAQRALGQQVPYTDAGWLEMTGAKALFGEAGYSSIERIGARPTLEVNGVWGGYIEAGAKTVLPARAHAKISSRLVADMNPDDVEAQLKTYFAQHMPEGVDWHLHRHSAGPGATMDIHSPYMKCAAAALEAVFGKAPIFKREGGSVPVVALLQQKLGIDSIMLGFALPDDGIHGPNERQYLPNFYRGIDTYIQFLATL
jgi:acetylornithine deacetylase/succinyl-diaminopimelate desuccinylase-like protein